MGRHFERQLWSYFIKGCRDRARLPTPERLTVVQYFSNFERING